MALKVLLTRSTNVYVGLSERARYANNNNAALFISYHLNAATASAKGYEDFTYPTQNSATVSGRETYHGAVLPALRKLNQVNRGKKVANFAVLRETNMPAILVELGFITNAAEYNTIAGAFNFEMLAQTHAQAIKDALKRLGKHSNATVVLDPGHGGSDPGAVANGHTEAAYVLRFTKRVKEILEEKNEKAEDKQMDKLLGKTQQDDMRNLLQRAYKQGIFSKDHSPNVTKMTRGEALDLLISYNARTLK